MSGQIMDGKAIGAAIRAEVAEGAAALRAKGLRAPGLAAVLVGENPASKVYVSSKVKACAEAGLFSEKVERPATATTEEVLEVVRHLNDRQDIDGILVQLPLPKQVDEGAVLRAIDPAKDVDGFHPVSVGNLVLDQGGFEPCTPAGIMQLLKRCGVDLKGKRAVVVGRSHIVGKPMALMLLREHATVTICHSRTQDLPGVCREADVLVAAMGKPAFITHDFIKPGAVVVDVGINRVTDLAEAERFFGGDPERMKQVREKGSTLVGDVLPTAMWEKASLYTPVPGGVGPLTIAMLLSNTLKSAQLRLGA
jgi:methylenetetrahydrofolate dehydrogenase (NADP+) / methenyltetrahydrofolate cyclohydrolase